MFGVVDAGPYVALERVECMYSKAFRGVDGGVMTCGGVRGGVRGGVMTRGGTTRTGGRGGDGITDGGRGDRGCVDGML